DDEDSSRSAHRNVQCPEQAAAAAGCEAAAGAPDSDDDGDSIAECPEPLDQCPGQPGKAPDGCPGYENVVVTDTRIELKQTIFFDTGRATIKPVSFPLLDEVAQALQDHPTIRVRIEGHTDSQGKDAYNLRLSRQRAQAVRQYLMGRGVAGD